jgi:hypothetical protein
LPDADKSVSLILALDKEMTGSEMFVSLKEAGPATVCPPEKANADPFVRLKIKAPARIKEILLFTFSSPRDIKIQRNNVRNYINIKNGSPFSRDRLRLCFVIAENVNDLFFLSSLRPNVSIGRESMFAKFFLQPSAVL